MESPAPRRPSWTARLITVAVSAAALVFVLTRVNFSELLQTLRHVRPGWFLGSIALTGSAFVGAAWRWQITLRLSHCLVHLGATTRTVFVGHFFYMIFFGLAGADVARSLTYARWFQQPLPRIFAAVSLDRILGFLGLLIFAAVAFAFAAAHGGFHTQASLRLPNLRPWAAIFIGISVVIFLFLHRQRKRNAAWNQAFHTFLASARSLFTSRAAAPGLATAVWVQAALSFVMAFNLRAVSHQSLPWSQMLWVFPVIFVLSSLPITLGGLGLRESAAMTLLGLYQVPPAAAVSAALLSFSATVVWMLFGGLIFFREERNFARTSTRSQPKTLSIIIPALNEAATLADTLEAARAIEAVVEIIVVDAGSSDSTALIATNHGARVLSAPPGRGGQMKLGASQAAGDVVLFLHADTFLPPDAGRAILDCLRDTSVVAGGFWKIFRDPPLALRGSRPKCALRLWLGRRIAGDQALFVRREVLEQIGGVPEMPLMEEFELCRLLRQKGRLALAPATVVTSARRFRERGPLRTYARMWRVMIQYYCGTPPEKLRHLYEKK